MDMMQLRRSLIASQLSTPIVNINIWDEVWENGQISTKTGEKINDTAQQVRSANYIPTDPNTTYYFKTAGKTAWMLFYDSSHNVIEGYSTGAYSSSNASAVNNNVFTTPTNGAYMMFYMVAAYGGTYNNDLSINYPSTDHDYHQHI